MLHRPVAKVVALLTQCSVQIAQWLDDTSSRSKLSVCHIALFGKHTAVDMKSDTTCSCALQFLHGIRTPVDTMQQLVPESGKHVSNKTLRKWVEHMNFCLAYSVTRHCHYVKFEFSFSQDIRTCFKDFKNVSFILILSKKVFSFLPKNPKCISPTQVMKMADKEVLKNELVEADGSGFSVLKKSGDVKHMKRTKPAKSEKGKAATKRFWNQKNEESRHGRFAVLRGRFTKKSILKLLPSRSVAKGSPGAEETVKEFARVVKKHVDGSSVIACTDSGSAVVGAFSTIGVPCAAGRRSLETWTLSFLTAFHHLSST